jgi:hypothetical protein
MGKNYPCFFSCGMPSRFIILSKPKREMPEESRLIINTDRSVLGIETICILDEPMIRDVVAAYLASIHKTVDAITEMKEAAKFDPLSVSILEDIGWMSVFARQYDHALNQANAIIEIDANNWSA